MWINNRLSGCSVKFAGLYLNHPCSLAIPWPSFKILAPSLPTPHIGFPESPRVVDNQDYPSRSELPVHTRHPPALDLFHWNTGSIATPISNRPFPQALRYRVPIAKFQVGRERGMGTRDQGSAKATSRALVGLRTNVFFLSAGNLAHSFVSFHISL